MQHAASTVALETAQLCSCITVTLHEMPHTRLGHAVDTTAPVVIVILHRLHAHSAPLLSTLLQSHLRHHRSLGVHTTVAYTPLDLLSPLLRDPEIAALVRAQQLQLVRWDLFAPMVAAGRNSTVAPHDMHIAARHAELSHAALNARLLHLDVRDFLVLPAQAANGSAAAPDNAADATTAPLTERVTGTGCLTEVTRGVLARREVRIQGGYEAVSAWAGESAANVRAIDAQMGLLDTDGEGAAASNGTGSAWEAPPLLVNSACSWEAARGASERDMPDLIARDCAYVVRVSANGV